MPDTTNHGGDVLEILGYYAPAATFDLYRVIAPNGRARRGDLVAAIGDAGRAGLDLLNLSVGVHHHEEEDDDCGGRCRIADETKRAVQDGTTVVAASGHRDPDDARGVHCPALLDETIGVGGFVSQCRHDLVPTEDSGQYWVRNDGVQGPFCGQRDCGSEATCGEYRYEQPWQGNVSFHNAVPDVLAPVHHAAGTDTEPILQSGTSFGTPVVTGLLAALLGDAAERDVDPTPEALKHAVVVAGASIDQGAAKKFDAGRTWDVLTM